VKALQGDIAYNAAAGSEILIHYLIDYAIKKGEHKKTGSVDNLARATYALYNGGPRHLRRYREAKTPKSLQKVDAAFWGKYQAIRAGNELAVTQCYGQSIPALQTSALQPDRLVSSPRAEPQRDTSNPQKQTTRTNHPANSAAKSVKREPWVLKQNPRYYTLQLTAAQDEQAILDYIYKSRLAANVAYYRFLRQGQPWFAVVYGAFPTRSEADRAALRLQADLQQASPWIREFSSVQEAIRESNSLSMNLFDFY
jgi:septal ring-binding cell division protein DamX